MNGPKVLQVGPLSERFNRRMAEEYGAEPYWKHVDGQAFLAGQGAQFEVLVTSARFGCTEAMLEALPNLRAVCSFGVGYDAIPLEPLRRRGIPLSNTPDVLDDCVADLAMGLLIDGARRIAEADRFVRAGNWLVGNFPLGARVSGKRLGILGLGRIGQALARRSSGFDMQVRYHNRRPLDGCPYGYAASPVELAQWADFLVLTCPGGPATHHLVNAEVLAALGPKGLLVNVARGSVVDEAALVAALAEGRLGAAALDVFEREPRVPAALLDMPNVVLLPHIGSATEETRLQMEELVIANLRTFIDKGELLTPV
ncbi:2-hydroxyacid dehydrogenase [Azotobacter vinelandii]